MKYGEFTVVESASCSF